MVPLMLFYPSYVCTNFEEEVKWCITVGEYCNANKYHFSEQTFKINKHEKRRLVYHVMVNHISVQEMYLY